MDGKLIFEEFMAKAERLTVEASESRNRRDCILERRWVYVKKFGTCEDIDANGYWLVHKVVIELRRKEA
jgi:hypothetical protein